MDSWTQRLICWTRACAKALHVISVLKTNRTLYSGGTKQSIKDLVAQIRLEQTDVVTVSRSTYQVYRYEGVLNVPKEKRSGGVLES